MSQDWWNGYAVGIVVMATLRVAIDLLTAYLRRRCSRSETEGEKP
jgi:hypothetical protein